MEDKIQAMYEGCLEDINDLYGGGIVDKVRPWLEVGPDGYFKDVWGFIQAGCNVFVVTGVLLCIIYLIINLSDRTLTQGTSIETFMKCFIEFVLSLICIVNAFPLVEMASKLGTGILNDIATMTQNAPANGEMTNTLLERLDAAYASDKPGGFSQYISLLMFNIQNLMLPVMLARIGETLAVIACMSRGISIVIYGVFLPIPIADIYKDGLNSKGIRYLKKLIALFIQGGLILMVVIVSQLLRQSLSASTAGVSAAMAVFYNLGLIFVSVFMIFKSQNVANDVLGV